MSKPLLIFPFGGNAREACAFIQGDPALKKQWHILGFIDDDASVSKKSCCGVKVLGNREILKKFPKAFVLAVPGSPQSYIKRKKILDDLKIDEKRFAQVIHPTAVIAEDAEIGINTLIMPHVVITAGVHVGNHCVILPNTTISHDSSVGDYTCIGSNVSVSGQVRIEEQCYIGSRTSIREKLTIGAQSLIGIGSNVIGPVKKQQIVVGNPAKQLKEAVL